MAFGVFFGGGRTRLGGGRRVQKGVNVRGSEGRRQARSSFLGKGCVERGRKENEKREARWTCLDVGFLGGLEETLELLVATAVVVPVFKK